MDMLRQELEDYLAKNYPDTSINAEHSLAGSVTLQFNTTENESSEIIDRINQGAERGSLVWQMLFGNAKSPIWIIAYEYSGEQLMEYDYNYFFEHFSGFDGWESSAETLTASLIGHDENGQEIFEKIKGKIVIGRPFAHNIMIEGLLLGIANKQNDIKPFIGHSVYFLNPETHTGFHMYDDKGIFIWANEAKEIEELYRTYNHWIPDYAREDIDPHFL